MSNLLKLHSAIYPLQINVQEPHNWLSHPSPNYLNNHELFCRLAVSWRTTFALFWAFIDATTCRFRSSKKELKSMLQVCRQCLLENKPYISGHISFAATLACTGKVLLASEPFRCVHFLHLSLAHLMLSWASCLIANGFSIFICKMKITFAPVGYTNKQHYLLIPF